MASDPKLTPDQEKLLQHEEFIAEVVRRRSPESRKPGWQVFLESAGGVALISILLGGIFTSFITHILQESAKERDFQNEIVKLYGQHQLAVQKEFTQDRIQTLRTSLEIIGDVINACQSRIDIDGPRFARRIDQDAEKKNLAQQEQIRKRFNEVAEVWGTKRRATDPMLVYYFGPDAKAAWREMSLRLDEYLLCAENHHANAEGKNLCSDKERPAAENAVAALIDKLEGAPGRDWLTQDEVKRVRAIIKDDS